MTKEEELLIAFLDHWEGVPYETFHRKVFGDKSWELFEKTGILTNRKEILDKIDL